MSMEHPSQHGRHVLGPYMSDVVLDNTGDPYGITIVYTVFESTSQHGWYDYRCRFRRARTSKKNPWVWSKRSKCLKVAAEIDMLSHCVPIPARYHEKFEIPALKDMMELHEHDYGSGDNVVVEVSA